MAHERQNAALRDAAQIGANRGARAFMQAAPDATADVIRSWTVVDPKPGRAAEFASVVRTRFPRIRTAVVEADGRRALPILAERTITVVTVDSIDALRDIVQARQARQTLCFQMVGRGPGPAISAAHLAFSGCIDNVKTADETAGLLGGLATLSEAASSRALTAAGDPISAALLHPMRVKSASVTSRYFASALQGVPVTSSLTLFTATGTFPLVARSVTGQPFSAQRSIALDAVADLQTPRIGVVAAVALVDLEERAVDLFFIARSREDRRRVEGIVPFRAPSQRYTSPAVFTD